MRQSALAFSVGGWSWKTSWPFQPLVRSDLGSERREAAADALNDPYYIDVDDPTVPEYVLAQIKAIVDLKLISMRALEGKAAQLVGFAGTVAALVGVFGRSVAHPLLLITVGLLVVSIILNLRGMAIREDDLPSPSLYNTARVAEKPKNKARVAMALAEAYTNYSLDLQHEAGLKARWISSGSFVFILGLVALLMVMFTTDLGPIKQAPVAVTVKCYTQLLRGPQNGRKAGFPAATTPGHAAAR
jgi:hypothetical protein